MKLKQITGQHIELNIGSEQAKNHFANPYNYTKEILEEWEGLPFEKFISPEDKIFLDIGANVGLFALHVMPYVDRIICVEPTPEHMEIQKELLGVYRNLYDKNNLTYIKEIIIHEQAALNSFTGKTGFHRCGVNTTMNSLDYQNREPGFEVDCITLFDLCEKYNLKKVDFCKIDIEGSEFKAITVETVKPVFEIIDKILMECHPRSRESQDHFKAIFEEAGYKTEYYDFNGSIFAFK